MAIFSYYIYLSFIKHKVPFENQKKQTKKKLKKEREKEWEGKRRDQKLPYELNLQNQK